MATSDSATLDRMFRHMAWANEKTFDLLKTLTANQWQISAPGSDWSIFKIAFHMVDAQRWYVWRLSGDETFLKEYLESEVNFEDLADLMLKADQRLREEAALPEAITSYERDGEVILRARSTILAQSIHHATEHRTQIADALAANNLRLIDLDELDLWEFENTENNFQ